MTFIRILIISFFISNPIFARGYDVFGIGYYDIKFDGGSTDKATDFRYERRFDKILVDIGPEEDNFFYLKPFAGIETTSKSAYYILGGVYLEDNLGQLFIGEKSKSCTLCAFFSDLSLINLTEKYPPDFYHPEKQSASSET